MKNLKCPFCHKKFGIHQIEFRCENPNDIKCPKEDDEGLAGYFEDPGYYAKHIIPNEKAGFDEDGRKNILKVFKRRWRLPKSKNCDNCGWESHIRVCPNCHNQLPTNFHKSNSHVISVIGERASGKTHYITVLIDELKKKGELLDITTIAQDLGEDPNERTQKRYERVYWTELFAKKKALLQTPKEEKDKYPLVYEIRKRKKARDKIKDFGKMNNLYLVFYDTAGETYKNDDDIKRLASYVKSSSGVIFLLDSFQVPKINKKLKEKGVLVPDVSVQFNTMFDIIYGHLQLRKRTKNDIPIAVTFSKIDEVIDNDLLGDEENPFDLRKNSSFLQEEKNRFYDIKEIEAISEEVRGLLSEWGESHFEAKVTDLFAKKEYFAVSALGGTPENGKIKNNEIKPHRVLDPLLWILDQLGFALPKPPKKPKS